MTNVQGSIVLQSVVESSLAGKVDHYVVTLTEAGGAAAPAPIPVALDATSFIVALDAGSWTASVVAVDVNGSAVTAPVVSAEPLVIAAPAMVQVPLTISLSVAP